MLTTLLVSVVIDTVTVGNGNNIIYVDWENDLVIVTRWSNALNDLVGRTIASLSRTN